MQRLRSDASINDFVGQSLRFRGIEATQDMIDQSLVGFAQNAAGAFMKNDLKTTDKLKTNSVEMAAINDAYARGRIKFKHTLDQQAGMPKSNIQWRLNMNRNLQGGHSNVQNNLAGNKVIAKGLGAKFGIFSAIKNRDLSHLNPFGERGTTADLIGELDTKGTTGNEYVDAAITALRKNPNIDLGTMASTTSAKLIQQKANQLVNKISQAQPLDVAYGTHNIKEATESILRSGAFQTQSFALEQDGQAQQDGLSIQEIIDKTGMTAEDIQEKAHIVAYRTPALGGANGYIVSIPGMQDNIIIKENSILTDRVYSGVRRLASVWNPGTDSVSNVDLSNLLPRDMLKRNDDGTLMGFKAEGKTVVEDNGDLNRVVTIMYEDGTPLVDGFGRPITTEELNKTATTRLHKEGSSGISFQGKGKGTRTTATFE